MSQNDKTKRNAKANWFKTYHQNICKVFEGAFKKLNVFIFLLTSAVKNFAETSLNENVFHTYSIKISQYAPSICRYC